MDNAGLSLGQYISLGPSRRQKPHSGFSRASLTLRSVNCDERVTVRYEETLRYLRGEGDA